LKYARSATGANRRSEEGDDEAAHDFPLPDDAPDEEDSERRDDSNSKRSSMVGWGIVAAFASVVVVAGGVSAYFMFFRGASKQATEKAVAVNKKKSTTPAPTPSTGKEVEMPDDPIEPLPMPPKKSELIRISAARLSNELASNPDDTNRTYENGKLEVSGLFEKCETKVSDQPSAHLHAVFAGEGPIISCDLQGSPTAVYRWAGLPRGQAITVRGSYGKNGFLHGCELMPLTPPADAKFKGVEIELVGFVDSFEPSDGRIGFPALVLEPETQCQIEVQCLFRKTDEESLRKIRPGTLVTIKGVCNGRTRIGDRYTVRIDNCQVVVTSAPAASTLRLEVGAFLREYEEDLRATLLPPAGSEEIVESPVSVTQLGKELATDVMAMDKYVNKVVIVSGKLQRKAPPQMLVLESGDTDQVLKVQCLFVKHDFADLGNAPEFRIRGFCTGLLDAKTLRLDNCETYDPSKSKDPRRITAEFLPHIPDRVLTYDVAMFASGPGTKSGVSRQTFLERDNGLTETVTTHTGKLVGRSLLEEGESAKWIAQIKTKKVRQPGPSYHWRISGAFLEVGQDVPMKNGELELVWQPVLKLTAKTGDSWKWTYANALHVYTVVRFETNREQTSVIIQEMVTPSLDPGHPSEIRHVYVRDLGEVERSEQQHVSSTEKKVLMEMKLIEDPGASPPKESKPEKSAPADPDKTPTKEGNSVKPAKTGTPTLPFILGEALAVPRPRGRRAPARGLGGPARQESTDRRRASEHTRLFTSGY
jgi:hypothetical protein